MAKLIVNASGDEITLKERPRRRSLLKYRDLDYPSAESGSLRGGFFLYDMIRSFAAKGENMPKRGTSDYLAYLDRLWKEEPILAGTIYGMVAKAQSRQWKIVGTRNNAARAANLLNDAAYSYWKHGWWGFVGVSALDFYTCPNGVFWAVQRQSEFGQITSIEHIDSHACYLTGSYDTPVIYRSPVTGQQIVFKNGEIINFNSMMLGREVELGTGFCAVERAMKAARLLVALHDYDIEKLNNLPPEGLATVSGLTQDEFMDSLAIWREQRQAQNSLTYPQVLWLMSQAPGAAVDVKLVPFSNLPENFSRGEMVNQYVNILANAFGVSASDIWFMGGGPFGTGKETELQHAYAKGKGEGEWFSITTQTINGEMPRGVNFSYDTSDIQEDLTAAQTAGAWVNALLPVMSSNLMSVTEDDLRSLLVEKGILPDWMGDRRSDGRSVVTSSQTMSETTAKEMIEDVICLAWSGGKLSLVSSVWPGMSFHKQAQSEIKPEPEYPPIRGKPIPPAEAERGAFINKATRESEMKIWADIPELRGFVEVQE